MFGAVDTILSHTSDEDKKKELDLLLSLSPLSKNSYY
jgi:hypothetical protein